MKVILFGATGMVGQGVLRRCLLDPDVEFVLTIGLFGRFSNGCGLTASSRPKNSVAR